MAGVQFRASLPGKGIPVHRTPGIFLNNSLPSSVALMGSSFCMLPMPEAHAHTRSHPHTDVHTSIPERVSLCLGKLHHQHKDGTSNSMESMPHLLPETPTSLFPSNLRRAILPAWTKPRAHSVHPRFRFSPSQLAVEREETG